MSPEDLHARCRASLGPRYLNRIAERLRVSQRHVGAWAEGRTPIPERHVEAIERLLAAQVAADALVTRWVEALSKRASEEEIDRTDILAALARRPEIGAACAAAAEDHRAPLSRRA